jgi:hypothetical protein
MTHYPKRFSYPKKPVTLVLPLYKTGRFSRADKLDAMTKATSHTGIVPFDWMTERVCKDCGETRFVQFFGFDTLTEAKRVEASFAANDLSVTIMSEDDERYALRAFCETAERKGERPTFGVDDEEQVYWRDHPYFRDIKPTH